MDDEFVDTLTEAILKNRRREDDNIKHNASDNVCDNDSTTNESDKPIERESEFEKRESAGEEQE